MFEVNPLDGPPQEACAPTLRPPDAMVSLGIDRARVVAVLNHTRTAHVELAIAAAAAFYLARRKARQRITRREYDDALNIAAMAISRLVPVYSTENSGGQQVAVTVDVTRQRFANGATELRSLDGWSITRLSIRRSDMLSALPLIGRAGLQFD